MQATQIGYRPNTAICFLYMCRCAGEYSDRTRVRLRVNGMVSLYNVSTGGKGEEYVIARECNYQAITSIDGMCLVRGEGCEHIVIIVLVRVHDNDLRCCILPLCELHISHRYRCFPRIPHDTVS